MKLIKVFFIALCLMQFFTASNATTKYFLSKEVRTEIETGNESIMHFVLDKVEFFENTVISTAITHTQWGNYPATLTMNIEPDNSFVVKDEKESFMGSGIAFGEKGKWHTFQYTDSLIVYTGEKFLGRYDFMSDQVIAQKSWHVKESNDLKYFSVLTGKYVTAEQFEEYYQKPDELSQFWESL